MRASIITSLLAIMAASADVASAGLVSRQDSYSTSVQNMKSKSKDVVVPVMEDCSLDSLLHGQKIRGLDSSTNNGPFCNPVNLTTPSASKVCTAASDYNSVMDDLDDSIYGNNIEFCGTYNPDNNAIVSGKSQPTLQGFIHEEVHNYASKGDTSFLAKQVMDYYTEDQVAVLTALTQNFVTFIHWHSDIPGVSP